MMKFPLVWRSKFEAVERDADRLRTENANLRGSNNGLIEERFELLKQLKVAQKNDQRDKKGKFTKAK